jgi:hypothetical protein
MSIAAMQRRVSTAPAREIRAMHRSTFSSSSVSKIALALTLGAAMLHAGCGGSSASQSDGPSSAKPKTSSSSGAGASSGATQDMGGGTAGATGSGVGAGTSSGAGSAAGDDSGADATAGSDDGGGTDGSSARLDGGGDAAIGGDCQPGDTTPCASFTTPTGTTLQLGPYGAQMDMNVGKGFENAVQSGDMPGNESTCQFFVDVFMEDPNLGTKLLQTTTDSGVALDFSLYTVYRPVVWPSGPVPVLTWGNGTCAQPEGYGALLRYVASYGYVVVAANSRWVGSGTPAPMLHALDYAAAANADSTSPYYGKLDMTKVGAMGHSQGGQATASAASDSRISDVIIFNAVDSGISKPYLTTSGDMDITNFTDTGMASAISAATVPAAWLYIHNPAGMGPLRGHLVLMLSPERLTATTTAWWQMMFRNDAASRAMFVGTSCGLCGQSSDYEYGANSLLK